MSKKTTHILKGLIFIFLCSIMICSTKTNAASKINYLKAGTTYTSFDFTKDGKRDKFKYVVKGDSGNRYAYIYVNGKYKGKVSFCRGGNFYYVRISKKNRFLVAETGFLSGQDVTTVNYESGKFKVKQTSYVCRYKNGKPVIHYYDYSYASLHSVSGSYVYLDFSEKYATKCRRVKFKASNGKLTYVSGKTVYY